MNSQAQCSLIHDLPELTLSVIWKHVCKLPMADRRALLATCKKALSTFGGLVRRMARMGLTMKQIRTRSAKQSYDIGGGGSNSSMVAGWASSPWVQGQQRGTFSTALLVLSCFKHARLERLDLHFRVSPNLMLSPALAAFFLSSRRALEHVTCLRMNCREVSQRLGMSCIEVS